MTRLEWSLIALMAIGCGLILTSVFVQVTVGW
jgi:hypothetical protein